MTRCPDSYRPSQHSGRARYRFAGRVMRCVLEEGHEGAHVHEPSEETGPGAATTAPSSPSSSRAEAPKSPAPARVDLHALFRENARKRAWGGR